MPLNGTGRKIVASLEKKDWWPDCDFLEKTFSWLLRSQQMDNNTQLESAKNTYIQVTLFREHDLQFMSFTTFTYDN